MVLTYFLCADFGASRQNRRTIIEKHRSAEGRKYPPRKKASTSIPCAEIATGGRSFR
jgi:hypothetical protein